MKKLPVGISSLEKIIQHDYCYVDKTHHVVNLMNGGGGYYFLSRPRRFGKSLLVDTLKQAFLARRELFEGLYIDDKWDWSVEYPVVHLDFSRGMIESRAELTDKITSFLDWHYEHYAIDNTYTDISNRFFDLIEKLANHSSAGRVVVLVDEYDKPILDNITESELASDIRNGLKDLYSVIKGQDANLQFVLLTGVSKFSKVNLFSGLNNLTDITLNEQFADICGYTQTELEDTFVDYLQAGNVDLERLKLWYNGYNFAGSAEQTVYNPYDILLFFYGRYRYQAYWFETATPSFLIRLFEKHQYFIPNLEEVTVSDETLATFDVERLPLITLLFQTGYLTIQATTTIGLQYAYKLSYPNLEVKASLNSHLAEIVTTPEGRDERLNRLAISLTGNDLIENEGAQLKSIVTSLFASIPHEWYRKHDMHRYEGFYASIVYSYLAALGYTLIPEDITNHGKIDLTMKLPDKIVIFEFKLNRYGTAQQAIEQIKDRQYPQQYEADRLPIYLVGISFDETDKNVADFEIDKA